MISGVNAGLRRGKNGYEGILLINKPLGFSSFRVVATVRRLLGIRKVGHAGTLDPLATGLLVILVGDATKQSDALMAGNKIYRARIRLGVTTNTDDREGFSQQTLPHEHLDEQAIREILSSFLGQQMQIPPQFSAKKVAGKVAYKAARSGIFVPLQPRMITIYRMDFLRYQAPLLEFDVECSKGTYIRALARDIGTKLGCGAHLHQLCRLQSGNFSLADAISLDQMLCSYDGLPEKCLKCCKCGV
jgi:tRNA pseudouridine55 synthase